MACDLCKGVDTGTLVKLLDSYQTDSVKSICRDCEKKANEELWRLRGISSKWIRKKMRRWAGGGVSEPPASWWKKLTRKGTDMLTEVTG